MESHCCQHNRRTSNAGRRSSAGISDQHGNGAGGCVRRGQCDHAEAPPAVSSDEAVRKHGIRRSGRRNSRVPGSEEHRRDRSSEHHVPDEGHRTCVTRDAIQRVDERDTRLAVQRSGHCGRDGGGAGDDRRKTGRWTVRAVSVRAEREPGVLGSSGAKRDDGPRPHSLGWGSRAVPDPEFVAVPKPRPLRTRRAPPTPRTSTRSRRSAATAS